MFFFFSSRRRHARLQGDWSSDVCSSDLLAPGLLPGVARWRGVRVRAGRGGRRGGGGGAGGPPRGVAAGLGVPVLRIAQDRKSVVQGKSVDLGGRRIIKKKTHLPPPSPPR